MFDDSMTKDLSVLKADRVWADLSPRTGGPVRHWAIEHRIELWFWSLHLNWAWIFWSDQVWG